MKILIWGAGGIGAYYAARLIRAGHEVVLVARGEHLQALQATGLKVDHEEFCFEEPVCAISWAGLEQDYRAADFDAILLTIKANGTAALLQQAGSWLKAGNCPVISLQNGVDNEELLAGSLPARRVIGGLAVRIGGHVIAPGKIQARGPAQLIIGHWPTAEQGSAEPASPLELLGRVFNEAGIPTRVTTDIRYELWRKLLINNGVNPLSALTRLDTRTLTQNAEFGPIVYGLMQEAARAANAAGVSLGQADIDEMFELIRTFAAIKTSMLVDLEMGRPLELDAICGAVVGRCRAAGQDAPYTSLVLALLRQSINKQGDVSNGC